MEPIPKKNLLKTIKVKEVANERVNFFPTEIKELTEKEKTKFILNRKSKKIKIVTKQQIKDKILLKKMTGDKWKTYRKAAGKVWIDPTLQEWDENDYRICVMDLGNEISNEDLQLSFNKYPSFLKCKIIKDARSGKSKGYGFVSLGTAEDYKNAMKEMEGVFIGNRPVKLQPGKWKDRSAMFSKSRVKNWVFVKQKKQRLKNKDIQELKQSVNN